MAVEVDAAGDIEVEPPPQPASAAAAAARATSAVCGLLIGGSFVRVLRRGEALGNARRPCEPDVARRIYSKSPV